MTTSIITIGNGGYNIAADAIRSGIFSDYKLIVCDTDAEDLERNSVSADCSFLLDSSVDIKSLNDNHLIKSIVDELTDRVFIFAALGGIATQINVPPIVMSIDPLSKFTLNVITMPADYEGKAVMKRASNTCQWLSSTDMFLVQNNNKLSSIPGLTIGEMNKPIVETLAQVSQFDIRKNIRFKDSYDEFIPERYREAISLFRNGFKYPSI